MVDLAEKFNPQITIEMCWIGTIKCYTISLRIEAEIEVKIART
jgi:hypothetical protein